MGTKQVKYRQEVLDFLEDALKNHEAPDKEVFELLSRPFEISAEEIMQNIYDKTDIGLIFYKSAETHYDELKSKK